MDVELEPDLPFAQDHCGTCSACVSACPTHALLGRDANGAPVMDATRCISYLTIENRGPIPRELRALIGNRIFGCDICQEVCPWNVRFAHELTEPALRAREAIGSKDARELAREILALDDERFRAAFRGSPMKRAKLRGLKRNAAVVLGNVGTIEDLPALAAAAGDPESLVRDHAAWAAERVQARTLPL
jgi:epoxyqueuosine reductase